MYNLEATPYTSLVSKPDRFIVSLELLLRVAVLRRDIHGLLPNQAFWSGPLENNELIAHKLVTAAVESKNDDAWQDGRIKLEATARSNFEVLARGLEDYAQKSNLRVAKPRGGPVPYEVTLHSIPPNASIQYMTFLEYELCDKKILGYRLDKSWLHATGKLRLIGKYRFRLEWTGSANAPVEGNFFVDHADPEMSLP